MIENFKNIELNNDLYFSIIDNMLNAYAYHKIIYNNENKAIDYKFLIINKAFEKTTGLKTKDLIGKTLTQVIPKIELEETNWIQKYAEVSESGKEIIFESYSNAFNKYYKIKAYSTKKGYFETIFEDITEYNLKKIELEKSEQKYRSLFENTGTIACIIGENKIIKQINSEFEKELGFTKEYIENKLPFTNFIHKEDLAYVVKAHEERRIKPGEIPKNYAFRVIDVNNNIKHMYINVDIITGTTDSYASLIDITELKKTQELLKESEEKYRIITESSIDMIYMCDIFGNFIYVNEQHEKIFGRTSEEVIGTNISKYTPLSETIKNLSIIKRLIIGKKIEKIKSFVYHKDGRLIPVELNGKLIKYKNKSVIIGFVRDISSQIKAKKDLKESEEKFQIFTENANDVIWTMDLELNFLYVSPSIIKLRGYTPDEVISKKGIDSISPSSQALMFNEFRRFLYDFKKGITVFDAKNIILEQPCKNGSTIWTESVITAVFDEHKTFKYLLGVTRDITERKKIEQEINETNYKLSIKNKELEQFAYVATHDMRSPILNLKGLVEIFDKENICDSDNRKIIEKIHSSVDRLYETLNDLIGVIAYEKSIDQSIKEISLASITNDVILDLENIIYESKAEINIDFDIINKINYIPGHLKSILQNLITNAIKYRMPDKKLKINIKTEIVEDFIMISIKDNGIGIKDDHKEKVFDLFKKLNSNIDGKGIGLFVTKSQIESKGGRIELESEYGVGSTFKVFLKNLN